MASTDVSSVEIEEQIRTGISKRTSPQPENPPESQSVPIPTKKSSKSLLKIAIISSISLIILVVAALYPRSVQQMYSNPIPYLFDPAFEAELCKYLGGPEYKQALLVYGPPGIGKTRGISTISQENRIILDFDFLQLSKSASPDDIADFFAESVFSSFKAIDGRSYYIPSMKSAISLIEAFLTQPLDDSYLSSFARSIKDPLLLRASSLVTRILSFNGSSIPTAHAFLESLSALSMCLQPVLVLHDPHLLLSNHGCNESIRNLIFSILEAYQFQFATIIDLSDQISISSYSIPSVRLFRVSEFPYDLARKKLVEEKKIFTHTQLYQMHENFGGIGKYFADAYELLREGHQISSAIATIEDDVNLSFYLSATTSFDTKEVVERKALIKELLLSGQVPTGLYPNSTKHFIADGVVSYSDLDHVVFSNKLIANVAKSLR